MWIHVSILPRRNIPVKAYNEFNLTRIFIPSGVYYWMMDSCEHLKHAKENVLPKTPQGCEECLAIGDSWVHLRLCLTCGHIGCCDNSVNKHATKHFHATKHPVIKSYEKGENWKWCYIDEIMA
jgi:uncharacterized UBP type Zn finger protein